MVRTTASEQTALTCFTIDAILNKDGDKTALKTNYSEDTNNVRNSDRLKLHQCGDAKTKLNACKDDRESSKHDKVKQTSPSPDFGGSHFTTMTNKSPSRDSGVFLENDAGPLSPCTPAFNFIWMPPSVPSYPFFNPWQYITNSGFNVSSVTLRRHSIASAILCLITWLRWVCRRTITSSEFGKRNVNATEKLNSARLDSVELKSTLASWLRFCSQRDFVSRTWKYYGCGEVSLVFSLALSSWLHQK